MKLFMWFKTKKKLIEALLELTEAYNTLLNFQADKLEELDQNKKYYICMENATALEMEHMKNQINIALSHMRWTGPNIFITNKKLKKKK